MSDSADFEEGEVDDLSDFEDGNPGDVGTVFALGDGSCDDSPSHRGVSHGNWREAYRDRDVRDIDPVAAVRDLVVPFSMASSLVNSSICRRIAITVATASFLISLSPRPHDHCWIRSLTISSRSAESVCFSREASSMHAPPLTQFPQGALTEPYGDVDYRHLVHSGQTCVGVQPGVPCGFQPSPQAVGRRLPIESHPQHFRRPMDEGHLRPPPGYGGPPPFRGPFPPSYRFNTGKYPLPHRPPLPGGNREPPMPYPPPRFRPPYHDSGGENFYNSSADTDDFSPEPFTKTTDLKKQSSPSSLGSPANDQREIPPKMTVSKDVVVYLNEKPNAGATPVTFKWHIIPLEFDKSPHQLPPSATNANPADPRLKARPQLPVLLTIPSASIEEKQSEVKNPPQPERRKRPKLTLNEMANTFAKTGHRVQSKTPVLYSNILDPRLLKRQKVESEVASPENAAEEEQPLTPKALRVVFSP
ncbi:hypothetical protein TcWFU_002570 [Taenia crassiceps]|uniref:Uncharacterized protein n=1 Tax=Taenia crassiceps TaxID=6207 RepID=A0ABR4QJN7_9CEST